MQLRTNAGVSRARLHCVLKIVCVSLLCCWVVLLAGCSKTDAPAIDQDSSESPGHISGMGPSDAPLKGEVFKLSSAIEISGGIKGVSFGYPGADYCQVVGSGAFVLLSMEFINNTGKDTVLVFPAGLSFASKSQDDQNGILIQDLPVHLLKGATCKALVYAYCINEHRHGSSDQSLYTFGPICNAAPVRELIQLLANKKVNLAPGDTPSLAGPMGNIQVWIWQITDGTGLSEEDKRNIQALPGK